MCLSGIWRTLASEGPTDCPMVCGAHALVACSVRARRGVLLTFRGCSRGGALRDTGPGAAAANAFASTHSDAAAASACDRGSKPFLSASFHCLLVAISGASLPAASGVHSADAEQCRQLLQLSQADPPG